MMLLETIVSGHIAIGNVTWEQIGLGLLLVVGGVIAINLPYWKPKGPLVECQATIKSKRIEYSNTPQMYYRGNRWNHLILFVDENGNEIELCTSEQNYKMFNEGDIGKLTYQRDAIIEFETE